MVYRRPEKSGADKRARILKAARDHIGGRIIAINDVEIVEVAAGGAEDHYALPGGFGGSGILLARNFE